MAPECATFPLHLLIKAGILAGSYSLGVLQCAGQTAYNQVLQATAGPRYGFKAFALWTSEGVGSLCAGLTIAFSFQDAIFGLK